MERVLRFATLAVAALLLLPAVTGADGFPISTHPMYASVRESDASFVTAVGVLDDDTTVRLNIRTIAETDDPLVAEQRTRRAAETGTVDELCRAIADRVASPVVEVEVRTETYDLDTAGLTPPQVDVLATCERVP